MFHSSGRMPWGFTAAAMAVTALAALVPTAATSQHVAAAPTHRSCTSLAHVGDSLTVGMKAPLAEQYQLDGWSSFRIDAKGGRGIASFMYDDMTGLDAVRRIEATGFDGCWVMALGTNDAALTGYSIASATDRRGMREALIRQMMDLIGDAPVMWVNTHLYNATGQYTAGDAADWNDALGAVARVYPNMMVFDWNQAAAEHPEWTGPDHVHDTPLGSAHRAQLVAWAATAFLRGGDVGALGPVAPAQSADVTPFTWWAPRVNLAQLAHLPH